MFQLLLLASIGSLGSAEELVKTVGILRHGHRTPIDYFIPEDWPRYKEGDLTQKGLDQEIENGRRYGKQAGATVYKVMGASVEAGVCDPSKVQMIFSCRRRTIKSGLGYLKGLCFKNFNEVIPQVVKLGLAPLITKAEDREKLLNLKDYSSIDIVDSWLDSCKGTSHFFQNNLLDFCPNIWTYLNDATKGPYYLRFKEEITSKPAYKSLLIKFKISEKQDFLYTMIELEQRWEQYMAYQFANKSPGYLLNAEELDLIYFTSFLKYYLLENGNQFLTQVQVSAIFSEILTLSKKLEQPKGRLLVPQEKTSADQAKETEAETPSGDQKTEDAKPKAEEEKSPSEKGTEKQDSKSEPNENSKQDSNPSPAKDQSSESNESQTSGPQDKNQDNQDVKKEEDSNDKKQPQETTNDSPQKGNTASSEQRKEAIDRSAELPESYSLKIAAMENAQYYTLSNAGLTMFSGHDSNIVSVIRAFLTDNEIAELGFSSLPPYASTVYFEFWKINSRIEVGIKYNARLVKSIENCPTKSTHTCTLDDFMKILKTYTLDDIWAACFDD